MLPPRTYISDYLLIMLADQYVHIVVAGLSEYRFELSGLWPRQSVYIAAEYYGAIPTLFVSLLGYIYKTAQG